MILYVHVVNLSTCCKNVISIEIRNIFLEIKQETNHRYIYSHYNFVTFKMHVVNLRLKKCYIERNQRYRLKINQEAKKYRYIYFSS